ncbi:unnamed protein product [Hyaloperonospora brassicae]|uniref:RxLR effector candidate protein n=1 Tax=Hyaloperonospora brassicae TaxID=162125 RepID=A0AAV0UZW9_HYABA|nr:unnamed protein product [Hyaloperonospora brassicae]
MTRSFFLLVLTPVVVASGDALLDHTAGIRPDFASSDQDQVIESNVTGTLAFRSTEGTTNAASDERMLHSFESSAETIGALASGSESWIPQIEEGIPWRELLINAASDAERAWENYATAWRDKNSGLSKSVADWRMDLDDAIRAEDDAWVEYEADCAKAEATYRKLHEVWGKKRAARKKRQAAWNKFNAASKSKRLPGAAWAKDPVAYRKRSQAWKIKMNAWKKDKAVRKADIAYRQSSMANVKVEAVRRMIDALVREIKTYLREFEDLEAMGVTVEGYQKRFDLDPLIVNQYVGGEVTREILYRNGPAYTKYLCYKIFIESGKDALLLLPYQLLSSMSRQVYRSSRASHR